MIIVKILLKKLFASILTKTLKYLKKIYSLKFKNANTFNSKGDVLITGGDDAVIKIWNISKQSQGISVKKDKEIKNHTGKILHLNISVDDFIVTNQMNLLKFSRDAQLQKMGLVVFLKLKQEIC